MMNQPTIKEFTPSPNQNQRYKYLGSRVKVPIEYIIIHNTTEDMVSTRNTFLNPQSKVSAHFVIDRNLETTQFVHTSKVAWHAGNHQMNMQSIGIEVEAYEGAEGFAEGQEELLAQWLHFLVEAHKVNPAKILMHRQVRATLCPSFLFPQDSDFIAFKNIFGF